MNRQEASAQTRQRLLDAALAILDEEGERGLTTTAVTRRAGLAQSGFYGHFADMGALLVELVADVWAERRRASASARHAARTDPGSTVEDVVRASVRATVDRSTAHPALLRLIMRARLDPDSPLGAATRAKDGRSRGRVVARLAATGTPVGTAAERRRAAMAADGLMAMTETLALGHLDGRYRDLDEIVDVLVTFASAASPPAAPATDP